MRRLLSATASIATAALGLTMCLSTPSQAAPITFTWDPAATGDSTAGQFTANNFNYSDFATIQFPTNTTTPGSIIENGFLIFTSFFNGTSTVPTGVNTRQTATHPGFGLYEQFTTTSSGTGNTTNFTGAFDSASVTFYIYSTQHGLAHVSFTGPNHTPIIVLPSGANPLELATETGPISGSPNVADINQGVPTASIDTLFTPNLGEAGFFVSPNPSMPLDLEHAFTNTTTVVSTIPSPCKPTATCFIEIKGGGGNGTFFGTVVPEPTTLALFGAGLSFLGLVRRRRS
ncbi:MAG TPA: flocculation-associated PEP-CTERM protein PepA [Acetobacteraceae bacterium]